MNDASERYTYSVYNSTGQLIADGTLQNAIDLSNYATGLYLIQISNQATAQTYKVIKN